MGVDWGQLPAELLESISKNIKIYADYLRFQVVCRNWRSAVSKIPHHLPPQLPWLVLPPSRSHPSYRAFFNISTDKLHFLSLPEYSANPSKRHRGSSQGWLLILDLSPSIFLLNPLSGVKLHLPPLTTFSQVKSFNYSQIGKEYMIQSRFGQFTQNLRHMRDRFIKKIALSSSPSTDPNFTALAIINDTDGLAYCRSGVDSWIVIENAFSFTEDVIYFQGLFYAVNIKGEIAICDVNGSSPIVQFIRPSRRSGGDIQYLVNSGEDLFLITRHLSLQIEYSTGIPESSGYRTKKFDVLKLNRDGPVWEEVGNLGDKAVFIGGNSSLSVEASDFPGCAGNCIYYTDEYSEFDFLDGPCKGNDMGVYNTSDGSIEPLPSFFFYTLQWPPPIWLSPNPY